MPNPNIERLRAVFNHVKSLPNAHDTEDTAPVAADQPVWNQHVWYASPEMNEGSCGTAACFAGWAVVMFADNPIFDTYYSAPGYAECYGVRVNGDPISEPIAYIAQELLGLDTHTADELFHSDNDIYDLDAIIDAIEEYGQCHHYHL